MTSPLTAERLFKTYFEPWYPPDALSDLARARVVDVNPGKNPTITAQLEGAAQIFAKLAPGAFGAPDLVLDLSDASVHRLGEQLTRARRDVWLAPAESHAAAGTTEQTPPTRSPPLLVNIVTHGAIYVGACIVKNHAGEWQARRPLWESLVRLDSRAGRADLAVFHWWLKSLADEEIDAPRLTDRYRTHVEVPTLYPEALPVIAPTDRKLPRLGKVSYSALYKHLRAHLPELHSVGDDFPSPERIDELHFKWLDFKLLGGGRMLLIHGPSAQGVHLFWLDVSGFAKSAYYPADVFPEHVVQIESDKLRVIVPIQKEMKIHEMLWWGP